MADIFNGTLTMADDWGSVVNAEFPDGAPASGAAVQSFIKENLSSLSDQVSTKPGYFFSIDDEAANKNILLGFIDEAAYTKWQKETNADPSKEFYEEDGEQKKYFVSKTTLNKSTPQPYDTVLLENKMNSNVIISTDNTVVIDVKFTSTNYQPSGGEMIPQPTDEDGLITVQRRANNGTWSTIYETTITSKNIVSLDLTDYLSDGKQEVRMQVYGLTTKLTTTWLSYDVTKTNLGLTFATAWQYAQTTNYMALSYYMTGAVNKYLNIKITGAGGEKPREMEYAIGTKVYAESSGAPYSFNISDNNVDPYKVVNQGVHTIEAWVTVKLDGAVVAESDHVTSQILMITNPNTAKPYIIMNNLNTELTNWSRQDLFSYAVYHPTNSSMPVSISLSDYNTGAEFLNFEETVNVGEIKTYSNTIEVEGNDELLYAKLEIESDGVALTNPISITINNKGGYSPTAGADFIFNPRSRSNNVENPAYIVNSVDNSIVPSVWNGFTFSRDGWVEDNSGNRCLRVIGGQTLEIDYNPFMDWGTANSCTIEMSVAVRNIVDETIPVLRMCRYKQNGVDFEGWEMKPLEAVFMTANKTDKLKQDIWLQEDSQVHIAINILHNMYTITEGQKQTPVNMVRIFVNGIINREFAYEEDTLGDNASTVASNLRKIIIGDVNASADIDVYNIRVYKKALSSADILQDYVSNLPTATQKEAMKIANDILGDDDTISYAKASAKYNTLLWKFAENQPGSVTQMADYISDPGGDNPKYKGDLHIRVFNDDGTLDETRSGMINNMTVKGQGTSSMTYWKWNQRWEFKEYDQEDYEKGYRNSLFTPLELSNNYTLQESWDWVDDDGEIIAKNKSKWVHKETGEEIDDPRTASWQPEPDMPFAKRLDAKMNWASPMQSHKLGSVNLYNDLWKIVIGTNEIIATGATSNGKKFTGMSNGYGCCRVSVIQRPFMVFVQRKEGDAEEFYGLYTMGPSKGDKPTFGYNKKDFPNFVMMEGCDNGAALVNCRVPWNDIDVTIPIFEDDGEMVGEVYHYNNEEQWEVSMGSTKASVVTMDPSSEYYKESKLNPVLKKFRELNNFCYRLNPNLKVWEGTFTQLKTTEQGLDTSAFYWTTSGADGNAAYNVYRYDDRADKKKWVHAGVEYNEAGDDYEPLNLVQQTGYSPSSGSYTDYNREFINRRVLMFKEGISEYVDVRDMRYSMQFLKLIAASDNWAKNTYIYNAGIVDEETGEVTSKFRFFQDDLDTIFSLNNTGYKVKPYYVEEHDKDANGANYWNASKNAFYVLAELAWPNEMRDMMKEILSAASQVGGGSVIGAFDNYYHKIVEYFPAIAYNEIARLLYEDAYKNMLLGNYTNGVDPLAQCVGDQKEAERQWQMRRSIYLSSYAQFGEFAANDGVTSSGAIVFRSALVDGANPKYKFSLTPSMWLYPSFGAGKSSVMPADDTVSDADSVYKEFGLVQPKSSSIPPRRRVGETTNFDFASDGNTNTFLRGSNYYSNIGDWGKVSTDAANGFTLSGKRLTEFNITDADKTDYPDIVFRSANIAISGEMPAVKKFNISGKTHNNATIISGGLNLSNLWKLEEINVRATSITSLTLPENSNIHTIQLPSTLESLNLHGHHKLENLEISGLRALHTISIKDCPMLNVYDIIERVSTAGGQLNNLELTNLDWKDVTVDMLNYLLGVHTCKLYGKITLTDKETLDFNTKADLLSKFGDIDDINNDLYIVYNQVSVSTDTAKIVGDSYLTSSGQYEYDLAVTGNAFKKVTWSISDNDFATIDQYGVVTYTDVESSEEREATVNCTITIILKDGSVGDITRSKKIYFYEKVAEPGDYVYYDGSISSAADYNPAKTVVGICYYVNPDNKKDRCMVAVKDVATSTFWGLDGIAMKENELGDVFDVTAISNITSTGAGGGSSYYIYASDIEDATSSDGFKIYKDTVALGDIGSLMIDSPLTTERPEYNIGDVMPRGLKKTLEIIEHRNEKIIKAGYSSKLNNHTLRIPGKNELGAYTYNEMDDLNALLQDVALQGSKYQGFYYPAASYCYAFEPTVKDGETLNESFKPHKWYLPTHAEVSRIWYCQSKNLFATAADKNGHNFYTAMNGNYWTSTESDNNKAWKLELGSTCWGIPKEKNSISEMGRVRPVARF